MRRLTLAFLVAALTLPLAALPDPPDGRGWRKDDRRDRREDRDERHDWKEHDRREREYWKEREGREHRAHRYYEDEDRDRRMGRRPMAPPWMSGYWRPGESRRYVALVPGDPSRMYVFLDGRWVLREVRDPRARIDLEGAFRLPVAPPPIAPPHLGVDLRVVLFN